jgi:uncharacterized protein (TIGR02145 family)
MIKVYFALLITSILFSCKKEQKVGIPGANILDVEGNSYKTVIIGKQTWMAENLKVAKYNDGTKIPNIKDDSAWIATEIGAWCHYNNDSTFNIKYGKLYNWYTVNPMTNGYKNICPVGWHVPGDDEWEVLKDYLGGKNIAGPKLKEEGTESWVSPNKESTNISLFTALPGGARNFKFNYLNTYGYWHSASEYNYNTSKVFVLIFEEVDAGTLQADKNIGYSIRCLKD